MDIRSLVDSIERALGPNAAVDQVEKLARLFLVHSGGTNGHSRASHDSEPTDTASTDHLLVFANGRNRSGILAGISSALADLGCNILDVQQSVTGEHFMLMIRADAGAKSVSASEAQSALSRVGEQQHVSIVVQHADLFEAMNRV